ncbi:MAG: mercuric reductase [Anaerolineae bacterium]
MDAIIIGTGQAGAPLAARLAAQGKKVAIVERHKVGGSCVNYGCTPSKTLIASARAAYVARRGAEWGVHTGDVTIDFARVMERVRERIRESNERLTKRMETTENITFHRATGYFDGTGDGLHRVRISDAPDGIAAAPHVFINTGTRSVMPKIDGLQEVGALDSESIFDLETLPAHLICLGGGYVSLELGQAFRRLGSKVTVIEAAPSLIEHEDADIIDAVTHRLTEEGIIIVTRRRTTRAERDGDEIVLTLSDHNGGSSTVRGSHLLVAVGRAPNTDALNLGAVGVNTDKEGYIPTNGFLQTNIPGIWALGDVNRRGAFTHTSYQDFEVVLDVLNGGSRSVNDRVSTYAMYIDPPLGRVGMNEKQARHAIEQEKGRRLFMSTLPMNQVSRAKEQGETTGLLKLIVDMDTEKIAGASFFGMHCDEVVQVVSYFMATGASYKVMRDALPVHPTVAEFLPTMLQSLKPLE